MKTPQLDTGQVARRRSALSDQPFIALFYEHRGVRNIYRAERCRRDSELVLANTLCARQGNGTEQRGQFTFIAPSGRRCLTGGAAI
jgi:hypothetical protein